MTALVSNRSDYLLVQREVLRCLVQTAITKCRPLLPRTDGSHFDLGSLEAVL